MKISRFIAFLLLASILLAPERAWALSPSLSLNADLRLLNEALHGYKLLANVDNFMRTESLGKLRKLFARKGIKPSLMWEKYSYLDCHYDLDVLMVPISFTESSESYSECKQRYIVICEPKQEEYLISDSAKIIKRIPLPKDFKAKEYDYPLHGQNLLVVEELRARLYHGTWRGFLFEAAETGQKGRTLTGCREYAIKYTNEISRGFMRGGMMDKGHEYQTSDNLLEAVNGIREKLNKKIRDNNEKRHGKGKALTEEIPEFENYGLGYGVVLKFWADKIFPDFSSKYSQGQVVEYNAARGRADLNCLTLRSKQDFVILAGVTKKCKWMDASWDRVEFPDHVYTAQEVLEAMNRRGTPLYDLYSYDPVISVVLLERSA